MTHTDEFNKSNWAPWTVIFSDQTVQFSVGRLNIIQVVPFCVININSPYCLAVFSAPHEKHKSGSIIWVGVKPEAAGHSRWLLAAAGKLTPQRRASSLPEWPQRLWGPRQWQLGKHTLLFCGCGDLFYNSTCAVCYWTESPIKSGSGECLLLECWRSFIKCLQTMILSGM